MRSQRAGTSTGSIIFHIVVTRFAGYRGSSVRWQYRDKSIILGSVHLGFTDLIEFIWQRRIDGQIADLAKKPVLYQLIENSSDPI